VKDTVAELQEKVISNPVEQKTSNRDQTSSTKEPVIDKQKLDE